MPELDDPSRLAGARDHVEEAAIGWRDGEKVVRVAAINRPIVGPFFGDHIRDHLLNRCAGGLDGRHNHRLEMLPVRRLGVLMKSVQNLGDAPAAKNVHEFPFPIAKAKGTSTGP